MLSTEDRQQALSWSERQQGKDDSKAFLVESSLDDIESLIERSGTGVRAEEQIGSRPPPGLLACSAKCRFDLVWQYEHAIKPYQVCQPGVRKPTWH